MPFRDEESMISKTAVIYQNVEIGENTVIEDFCIIGIPPKDHRDGELKTVIGPNSHIRSGTTIYAGNIIGSSFQTGNKANIRELNNIGDNVSIGTLSVIEHHVEIMNNVRIHSQVFIPEFSTLKESCWIGPNVVFTNAMYPKSPKVKDRLKGPIIESGAIVGANSTLLPGVVIGRESVIGSGSVVTKDVLPDDVVCGNPAKKIKNKSELPY